MRCNKSGIGNAILRKNTTKFLYSSKSIARKKERENVVRPRSIGSVSAKAAHLDILAIKFYGHIINRDLI